MISIGTLTIFNLVLLLSPPQFVAEKLNLMPLVFSARLTLFFIVLFNVLVSVAFEQRGSGWIASIIGLLTKWHRGRRRAGKTYKVIEGGMR